MGIFVEKKSDLVYDEILKVSAHGGDTASTKILKLKEHVGEHEDLVKNMYLLVGNDYALAA